MYKSIKSCIQVNNELSDFFMSQIGVRQGENLSPFLFSLYFNDLQDFLEQNSVLGTEFMCNILYDKFHVYFKLFFLLYADDTVLFSDSECGLQKSLDSYLDYCKLWKLEINTDKTKILVFRKRKNQKLMNFILSGKKLDVVDSFVYLGMCFKYNNTFVDMKKMLACNAKKAMYSLLGKITYFQIPIDLQLQLFDSLVSSVLLYSCEIWGYENVNIVESVHLDFCKRILKLKKGTPNYMVYGELGRFPLRIQIKLRMYNFWCSIVQDDKLFSNLYKLMVELYIRGDLKSKWLDHIKHMLCNAGLGFLWYNQFYLDLSSYKLIFKNVLQDMYIQEWYSNCNGNYSRCNFYFSFKNVFKLEEYLYKLEYNKAITLCKFRTSNHKFPIETGRWNNVTKDDRICPYCPETIGDEFHYLFICKQFTQLRLKYVPNYYLKNPSYEKMYGLFTTVNKKVLFNVTTFISFLQKQFK